MTQSKRRQQPATAKATSGTVSSLSINIVILLPYHCNTLQILPTNVPPVAQCPASV